MNEQLSLIKNEPKQYFVERPNLKINVFENFFDENDSNNYLKTITAFANWRKEVVTVWGKKREMKRRIAWYGDEGKSYSYSGLKVYPDHWFKELIEVKNRILDVCPTIFNSVLLNDYKDGNIGMGWHSDDEKELGRNPVIASVSFGAERDFFLKRKNNDGLDDVKIKLTNGSLLIMMGETQHFWNHSIPIRKKVKERRINLTFRKIL